MENARRSQDRLHKTHTPGKTAWDCPRTDALLYSWWWPSTHRSVRSVWREIREIISGNMQIPREAERLGIFPVCVCTCRRRLKWQYTGKVRGRNSDCYWLDPCHLGECLILVWSPHTHLISIFIGWTIPVCYYHSVRSHRTINHITTFILYESVFTSYTNLSLLTQWSHHDHTLLVMVQKHEKLQSTKSLKTYLLIDHNTTSNL